MSFLFVFHVQYKVRHTIPQEAEVEESGVQGQPQPVGDRPGLHETLEGKNKKQERVGETSEQ